MNNGLLLAQQATQAATVNVNLDQKTLDACLKTIDNFGNTIYQNICTGQSWTVPTGSFDWFMFFVALLFGGLLVLAILRMIFS